MDRGHEFIDSFLHNAAVIPPNTVILTMYSVMKQTTTPVKTVDRRKCDHTHATHINKWHSHAVSNCMQANT